MSHRLKFIGTVVAFLWCIQSARADLLSGSVAYNPNTQLYTYSYTLTNPSTSAYTIGIMVGPASGSTNNVIQPISTTSPSGWIFATSQSGFPNSGTYWVWSGPLLKNNNSISGFSFTTAVAPVELTSGMSNYFEDLIPASDARYAPPGYAGTNYIQVLDGQITAPDFGAGTVNIASVPEPSTLLLAGASCLLLLYGKRRKLLHGSI